MLRLAFSNARKLAHDYRTAFAAADIGTAYDQFLFDPTVAGPFGEAAARDAQKSARPKPGAKVADGDQ